MILINLILCHLLQLLLTTTPSHSLSTADRTGNLLLGTRTVTTTTRGVQARPITREEEEGKGIVEREEEGTVENVGIGTAENAGIGTAENVGMDTVMNAGMGTVMNAGMGTVEREEELTVENIETWTVEREEEMEVIRMKEWISATTTGAMTVTKATEVTQMIKAVTEAAGTITMTTEITTKMAIVREMEVVLKEEVVATMILEIATKVTKVIIIKMSGGAMATETIDKMRDAILTIKVTVTSPKITMTTTGTMEEGGTMKMVGEIGDKEMNIIIMMVEGELIKEQTNTLMIITMGMEERGMRSRVEEEEEEEEEGMVIEGGKGHIRSSNALNHSLNQPHKKAWQTVKI